MKKLLTIVSTFFVVSLCHADGSSIGKVYLPYVQPLEKEIEYRAVFEDNNTVTNKDRIAHKLGFGMAVSERWFTEAYVLYIDDESEAIDVDGYELEARYQMTEQGEYAFDWGMMMELERSDHNDMWEFKAGLITTKEWGEWMGAMNVYLIREWGNDVDNELESALSLQTKYRLSPYFEPGMEYYSSQDTRALGPVIMGSVKMTSMQKLFWHLGIIYGYNDDTPNKTIKFHLEYEFL